MSKTISVKTQNRRSDRFRYGQDFDYDKITFEMRRNPYAKKIVNNIAQAMAPKFDLIGKDGEVLKWSDEFWQSGFNEVWNRYRTLGTKYASGYGKVLLSFFVNSDKKELLFRVFEPANYEVDYDDQGGITKLSATEQIGGNTAHDIKHELGDSLEEGFFLEVIPIMGEKIGEGVSELESSWDTLFSLRTLSANATYFVVRVGGGLKVIKVPEAKLNDEKYMAKVENMLKSIDSAMSTITLPIIAGLNVQQPDFEIKSGTQINFLEVRDLLLGDLSVDTGMPREVFLGSELSYGSTALNQSALFKLWEEIQELWSDPTRWLVDTYLTFRNEKEVDGQSWNSDEIQKLKYRKRVEANEKDEVEVVKTKSEILTSLVANSITLESALTFLKLDELEIDTEALEEKKAFKDAMVNQKDTSKDDDENGKGKTRPS